MLPSVSRFLLVVTLSVAFGLAPRPPAKGVICQARVKSIAQFGAFCRMEDGVDGLIHISQLNPDGGRATSVDQWLTVGDTVAVRVLSVDDGKIALTLRDVVQGAEAPGLLSNWMPAARLGKPPNAEQLESLGCVSFTYARSGGAGGQNVNKLNTKCEARLRIDESGWPAAVQDRLRAQRASTGNGDLIVVSERHRTQQANRKDALEKLAVRVAEAWYPPKVRQQREGLTHAGKRRRRDEKRKLSQKKSSRSAARRGAFDCATDADAPLILHGLFGRRQLLQASAFMLPFAATVPTPVAAKRLSELSSDEQEALDLASRDPKTARVLASGLRIIDVTTVDDATQPQKGDRVYVHFKVWPKGFRNGAPADSSFLDGRPYDWLLGQPDGRIPPGIDEGVQGMREGEWRRLIVPPSLAYGESGLRKGTRGALVVQANEPVYVDLLMMSTAECDALLRLPGAKVAAPDFAHDGKQKSLLCKRGKP